MMKRKNMHPRSDSVRSLRGNNNKNNNINNNIKINIHAYRHISVSILTLHCINKNEITTAVAAAAATTTTATPTTLNECVIRNDTVTNHFTTKIGECLNIINVYSLLRAMPNDAM